MVNGSRPVEVYPSTSPSSWARNSWTWYQNGSDSEYLATDSSMNCWLARIKAVTLSQSADSLEQNPANVFFQCINIRSAIEMGGKRLLECEHYNIYQCHMQHILHRQAVSYRTSLLQSTTRVSITNYLEFRIGNYWENGNR